jgi:hypothetical protein
MNRRANSHPVVPLWDPESLEEVDFAVYEEFYPKLFQYMRIAGWSEARHHPISKVTNTAIWRIAHWILYPDNFLLSFGGLTVRVKPSGLMALFIDERDVTFKINGAFDRLMKEPGAPADVKDILGTSEAYPVAETEGHILFVSGTGEAALIEQTLVGYMVGDNAFSVLSRFLLGEDHEDVRVVTLREGY